MTTEVWHEALARAAECGSACLRDTAATIPHELRPELADWLFTCRIVAAAADIAIREGDR